MRIVQEPEYKYYIRRVLKKNLQTAIHYYILLAEKNIYVNDEACFLRNNNEGIEERFVRFLLNILNNNVLSETAKTIEKWKSKGILCEGISNARLRLFFDDYKIMIKVASSFLGTHYVSPTKLQQVVAYFESLQDDLDGIIKRMVKQEYQGELPCL
ncbi:MAG TPA: hypothetical protein VF691_19550 [Cytophagaceae bacterium]|jgi:hypothetical protein